MRGFVRALALLGAALVARATAATTLPLSDLSNDATPAGDLGGAMDFSVSGTTLTLTVSNLTSFVKHYEVNRAAFNARSNVTGLDLAPGEWRFSGATSVPGFGVFDYAVEPKPGIDPLFPQESIVIVFEISGAGPFADSDFADAQSAPGTGETSVRAAESFIHGPGNDSAWGAAAGEPLTGALCLMLDPSVPWPDPLRVVRGACDDPSPAAEPYDVIRGRLCQVGLSFDETSIDLGNVQCLYDDAAVDRFGELSPDDNPCAGGWFFLVRRSGDPDYGASFPDGLPEIGGACP